MDDLNRKRHAVYKLTYHAVFVIKYRRRVMTEPIITHMRQYATHLIEQCYQGKLLKLNGEPDHIHILFELPATAAPSVVVCAVLRPNFQKKFEQNFGMRSKISSGRIASGQTVISLPLPETQTLKH